MNAVFVTGHHDGEDCTVQRLCTTQECLCTVGMPSIPAFVKNAFDWSNEVTRFVT